jgi:hypothetical protein
MRKLLIGLLALVCISAFADEDLESAAIEAFTKSNIKISDPDCTKENPPKAIKLGGGGDTFPINFEVLVAQELNCGFYHSSVLTTVSVEMDFKLVNDEWKIIYKGDPKSVKVTSLKD